MIALAHELQRFGPAGDQLVHGELRGKTRLGRIEPRTVNELAAIVDIGQIRVQVALVEQVVAQTKKFLGDSAIGLAIDEGISKDIAAAISVNNPNFSMGALVKDALDGAVSQGVNIDGLKSVIIEKYGFQSAPDDTVIPLLELQLVCRSGLIQKINFVPNEVDRALPFDKVKTDGSLAEKALRGAVKAIFSQYGPSVCISA